MTTAMAQPSRVRRGMRTGTQYKGGRHVNRSKRGYEFRGSARVGRHHLHQGRDEYFEARTLKRHARVWSLWALGVGAVISGHYSGWNLGLAQGFGAMFIATIVIAIMYLGLTFSLAEMSPALPHTGGAYSFARTAMGPWAGSLPGIAENIEFVLTPAVIVFFIGSYLSAIFGTDPLSSRSIGCCPMPCSSPSTCSGSNCPFGSP